MSIRGIRGLCGKGVLKKGVAYGWKTPWFLIRWFRLNVYNFLTRVRTCNCVMGYMLLYALRSDSFMIYILIFISKYRLLITFCEQFGPRSGPSV